MEGASKHQVVVDGEFVQSRVEVPLVYESASSIDDDQCKDDPAKHPSIRIPCIQEFEYPSFTYIMGTSDLVNVRRLQS
jgi:hypothetical protein